MHAYLGDKVKVVHSVDLALVLCSGDHLALHIFIIRNGEALAHGAGGHELSAMRVVYGILQETTEAQGQTNYRRALNGLPYSTGCCRTTEHNAGQALCT